MTSDVEVSSVTHRAQGGTGHVAETTRRSTGRMSNKCSPLPGWSILLDTMRAITAALYFLGVFSSGALFGAPFVCGPHVTCEWREDNATRSLFGVTHATAVDATHDPM